MSSRKFNLKRIHEIPEVGTHHDGSASVYMMHKITKLREINTSDLNKIESAIFASCIIFINGVTTPPVEELRRLISIHGGECVNYRVSGLTHFVCDNFTDAQLKHEYSKKRINNGASIHNVRAQWIVDSIRESRRLDEILYLPKGLQEQFGRPITSHFSKAALSSFSGICYVTESASNTNITKNSFSHSSDDNNSSSSSSSSSSVVVGATNNSSSSSCGGGSSGNKENNSSSNYGANNLYIQDKNIMAAAENSKSNGAFSSSIATTTMTASFSARDSPSALGLTLSQEDFIQSVPLEKLQDDIFEQLIQYNLSRRTAKSDTGNIGIAASAKGAVDDGDTVIAGTSASHQQQHCPQNYSSCKKELQEMVSWIHRDGDGSAEIALRLLSYIEQLIHTFSGYKNRHLEDGERSGLCLPNEFHFEILRSYGVWLLTNDQFDNLAMFIRHLSKVCRAVTAAAGSLSGTHSHCEWQEHWNRVPLRIEEHLQKLVSSRFRCHLLL